MKEKQETNRFYYLYILTVIVLAVIYFTVPERKEFLEFQLKWWGEMWEVVKGG